MIVAFSTPHQNSVIHGSIEPGADKAPEADWAVGNTAHVSNKTINSQQIT